MLTVEQSSPATSDPTSLRRSQSISLITPGMRMSLAIRRNRGT